MAFNAFLKIEGLTGETTPIEVLSFSVGIAHPTTQTGGGGVGRVRHSEFNIVKHTDSASPHILIGLLKGQTYKLGVLSLLPAVQTPGGVAPTPFLKYEFSDLVITSVQHSGNEHGDALPTEDISFEYNAIEVLLPAVQGQG